MTFRSLCFTSLALLALAGCGGQSAAKPQSTSLTPPTATPAATQPPPATPVIKGGTVAAIVNGHKIPTSSFRLYLNFLQRRYVGQPGATVQALSKQAMNEVIIDELVRQYAAAHHLTASQTDVNKRIQKDEDQARCSAGQNGAQTQPTTCAPRSQGKKMLDRELAQSGLSFSEYKELLTKNVLGRKVVDAVAPLPKKSQPGPLQPVAHVRHILVVVKLPGQPAKRTDKAAHQRAQSILAQLKHGANFTALAKKYSEDPGSANKGGVYDVHPHQMVPEFEHASFTLPPHHPTIIKTQYGYHIIEVLSRGKEPSQALSPQQIQEQKFTAWIDRQMKRSSIKRLVTVTG